MSASISLPPGLRRFDLRDLASEMTPEGQPIIPAGEIRHAAIALAVYLCGGPEGYTKSSDPEGCFRWVTEGRGGATWKLPNGGIGRYSGCEDLAQAVLCCLAGVIEYVADYRHSELRSFYEWINRADVWGWSPGQNLLRIKNHSPAWRRAPAGPTCDYSEIEPGDIVQVQGATGPHTLILLDRQRPSAAVPEDRAETHWWTTADYGQVFDPDEDGPAPWDNGGRVYERLPFQDLKGLYSRGQGVYRPIIGHVDVAEHIQRLPATLPALVPPDYEPLAH